ncbi:hypothetical protein AVEN_173912-1 [Araneus ventricosus]|uniref:Endonuclease/exonuclease/phosphatase domain-containing protein n=1 Tax=Araneus ventricosus TaxID=182803 RepID=A0A4Y2NYI1_ARAVE|nr:hypothetical protein AVEN_173912-1 [Araneus ventricosus]
MASDAAADNLQLHGGASTSTGSFIMSSGLGLYLLIYEEFHMDKDVPLIAMGDFNVDVKRNQNSFGFMKKHFDLNMVPTNYPSTLGKSYIYIQLSQETLVSNY